MPTRSFSIRIKNYEHLEYAAEKLGCSMSEYLNILLERDGRVSFKAPHVAKAKTPKIKNIDSSTMSKLKDMGVSVGVPVREDRPVCRVCKMNLNSMGQCSNKGCKKFLKVQ